MLLTLVVVKGPLTTGVARQRPLAGGRVASRRLLTKTMHPYRSTATAPVWARDHFQIVAVGVGKIDPASAVVTIDLAGSATPRIGPILETLRTDAVEDGIEFSLGNQESVVLWLD